jgi:hypothetical protein
MNHFIHDAINKSKTWRTPQRKKEAMPFQVLQIRRGQSLMSGLYLYGT